MARAYNLLLLLLLPLVLLRLLWRSRRQPEYLRHVGERFGRCRIAPARPVIWLHAVSVGETRAAQPLVGRLLERYPNHDVVLTHMTPTGRRTSRELFGARVQRCYLPYDYPFAVRRFLRRLAPRVGVLLETELWPNLLAACRSEGIPLLLANARLSERSARRYGRLPRLTRQVLNCLSAIAAQTEADAARLRGLGAPRVEVLGNLKFDLGPPPQQAETARELRRLYGARPVLLCASTREGEEALILDALRSYGEWEAPHPDSGSPAEGSSEASLLLVVVPRHPQRFDGVARLIGEGGFTVQRRSAGAAVEASTQVLLGDTMGEMYAYYMACDVAFIGGSLLPLGGQNLIEACAVGAPVLTGPHTFNFTEATEQAIACGAAIRVADAKGMVGEAARLLADTPSRRCMGEAGRAFAARHRGATERTLRLVEQLLERAPA
jgi:3-deoxy-D-manno-octulosonic-acid transferase